MGAKCKSRSRKSGKIGRNLGKLMWVCNKSGHTFGHTPTAVGLACPPTNYFTISATLRTKEPGTVPLLLRTFCVGTTTIHLSYTPSIRRISVDKAADQFGLSDLRAAFVNYLSHEKAHRGPLVHSVGGARHAQPTSALPFTDLQIWFKVRIQNMPFHSLCQIPRAQTLFASPPTGEWTLGCYDAAIINIEEGADWPLSSLQGKRAFNSFGRH
jgi:hypothetical protein